MQAMTVDALDALGGFFRPVVQVDAWRAGRLLRAGLPVSGGSLTVTDGQAVRSRLTLTVSDPDGEFTPRQMSDPLAPFGSELHVKMGIRVGPMLETWSLGWFPVQSAESAEEFATYERPDEPGRLYRVIRGASTLVEAADRAQRIAEDRFLNREQPSGAVLAEVARLLAGRVPYEGAPGVGDRAIPADLTYEDDRLAAVGTLGDLVDADLVFTPSGSARLQPRAAGPVVWTIPDGPSGLRVSLTRRMQRDGVYNAVVTRGNTSDNVTLQRVLTLNEGPLAYGGPFGSVPYFHASSLLDTQAAVDAAAATTLARISQVKPQTVQVVCVINPAVEVGDTVRLPVPGGYVDGRVVEATWPLTEGETTMTLQVAVDPLALVVPA